MNSDLSTLNVLVVCDLNTEKKETGCHDLYQSLQVTEKEYKIAIPKTAENLLEG